MKYGIKNRPFELVIKGVYGNVIEVDIVLFSMICAVGKWYDDYYQNDAYFTDKNTHITYLKKFYDSNRFSDYTTLGEERINYLEYISMYVQTRKDD